MELLMATPKIRSRQCGLYLPGHQVHMIQGLRYSDPDHPRVPGRLIDVADDGILVVELDDEIRRYWHHDPQAFALAASRTDNDVELQARWSMLGTPTKKGYHPIYIADPDDHRGCPDTPPTGTALELLESAGGFLISASDLAEQLSD